MNLSGVSAVLLDMDGTLIDSDAAVERAWRMWLQEYGFDPEVPVAGIHGSPTEVTVRRLRPDLNDEEVRDAVSRQMAPQYVDLGDTVATPGALALLKTLAELNLPWAVVTSADARLAHARLVSAQIHPDILVTSDDIATGKPDPEGYLLAARRLNHEPARCLVVEDAEPGVQAGRAAGCLVAGLKGVPCDLKLADLSELDDLLRRRRA